MHTGRFPAPPPPLPPAYAPGGWVAALESDPTPERVTPSTRRRWLLGIGCFALGVTATLAVGRYQSREATPAATADWLDEMLSRPAAELLPRAGDYERKSRQHGEDARIVPAFTRLLEIAATTSVPEADAAAACAVRTLAKLGGLQHVAQWQGRLAHLDGARAEAARVLAEAREQARTRR